MGWMKTRTTQDMDNMTMKMCQVSESLIRKLQTPLFSLLLLHVFSLDVSTGLLQLY